MGVRCHRPKKLRCAEKHARLPATGFPVPQPTYASLDGFSHATGPKSSARDSRIPFIVVSVHCCRLGPDLRSSPSSHGESGLTVVGKTKSNSPMLPVTYQPHPYERPVIVAS